VGFDDWILALHVLSAFALVSALILLWFVYLALRANGGTSAALGQLYKIGVIVVQIGVAGTLVSGVWLAISLDAYRPWDGWVMIGFALLAIGTAAGFRAGHVSQQAGGSRHTLVLHAVASLAAVLILVDMIWKPGA